MGKDFPKGSTLENQAGMCVCPEYKVQEHSLPQLYNKAVAACEWVKLFFSEKSSLLSATIVL